MITTAKTIQRACAAGLTLAGANSDGEPEWIGTDEQFKMMNSYED